MTRDDSQLGKSFDTNSNTAEVVYKQEPGRSYPVINLAKRYSVEPPNLYESV